MRRNSGMTLVELMIVIVIIAILIAIAVPTYQQWVRKAHRGDAQSLLLNWANNLEIFRANASTYGAAGTPAAPNDPDNRYTFAAENLGTNTYVLLATAQGTQANDVERGQSCTELRLDQAGNKTPAICWQE